MKSRQGIVPSIQIVHTKHQYITNCNAAFILRSRLNIILKSWLLDSPVNWDSHQTDKTTYINFREGQGFVTKVPGVGNPIQFHQILFNERRHVRMAHL